MKLRLLLFSALAVLVSAVPSGAIGGGENEPASLPDSILNEEHVYRYLFTDRSLSERIMSEMRRRAILPDWELDYLEGDWTEAMNAMNAALTNAGTGWRYATGSGDDIPLTLQRQN